MPGRVLIVDNNGPFATVLSESIERETGCDVVVCTTADEARERTEQGKFDLGIIDLGLSDEDPLALIASLRENCPELRILVIPLMGEDVPEEAGEADFQGILTKPFFMGDLATTIQSAIAAPLENAAAPPPAPSPAPNAMPTPESPPGASPRTAPEREAVAVKPLPTDVPLAGAPGPTRPLPAREAPVGEKGLPEAPEETPLAVADEAEEPRLVGILRRLHRETGAILTLLLGGDRVIAHAGSMDGSDLARNGRLLLQLSCMASRALQACGGSQDDEEGLQQGYCDGSQRRIYWLTLDKTWLLVCVLSTDIPIGMLRYNMRQAAEELAPHMG